jgi:hypothetical protein
LGTYKVATTKPQKSLIASKYTFVPSTKYADLAGPSIEPKHGTHIAQRGHELIDPDVEERDEHGLERELDRRE